MRGTPDIFCACILRIINLQCFSKSKELDSDIIVASFIKEKSVSDARVDRFARILVDYSAGLGAGDRVLIEGTTAAESLVRAIFHRALEVGAHPHILLELPDQQEVFYETANESQLDYAPTFQKLAYETFESRIRIHSQTNPRALSA
ncbi:MAG TPA: hypothetical protein DCG54_06540, partial [Anaerolineae bacterium]|nr:hypothetical protein [Anaerolineae bacterium]